MNQCKYCGGKLEIRKHCINCDAKQVCLQCGEESYNFDLQVQEYNDLSEANIESQFEKLNSE